MADKTAPTIDKTNGFGLPAMPMQLSPQDSAELAANMGLVMEQMQVLLSRAAKVQSESTLPIHSDPFNTMSAFSELWQQMMTHPGEMAEKATSFWREQAEIWQRGLQRASGQEVEPVIEPRRGDKRFADAEWSENIVFDCLKQSYLHMARTLTETAQSAGDLDCQDRRKVEFHTRLFLEALSPSNFFATNPEVIRTTIEEKGANLVRGMKHMLEDYDEETGYFIIRQTDRDKFKVGENMAVTPGKVIYRNAIMELIQYEPTTEKVQKYPLLICPPWINKYYILDLNPKKSMVKWLVEQGHTVFLISWINPDERHKDKEFVDYVAEGLFEGMARTLEETGAEKLHVTSYCIGGTMTATALSYLASAPDHPLSDRIASSTFLTTQTEFSNAGELQLFIDDQQLEYIQEQMRSGVLSAQRMGSTFNLLRSADLIWSFVVQNYLLGREPFPFDLLYWNSDSTSMPARVHTYYLKKFYRDDALARGELSLGGVPLDLGKITIPTLHIATKEDHIAPPDSVYRGYKLFGGDKTFVLAGSGHIAGVVNPPASGKYQYWTRDDEAVPGSLDGWREACEETAGSWWPLWDAWLKELNGNEQVPARQPGRRFNALDEAPGMYVKVRYNEPKPEYDLSEM